MATTNPAPRSEWRERAAIVLCLFVGLAGILGQRAPRLDAATAPPNCLSRPIDLNHDPAWILTELPHIGPRRAQAIVEYRASNPLTGPDDLLAIRGIGPSTVAAVEPYVGWDLGPGPNWTDASE